MERSPKRYQKLFAELKRRRVFKTAALYGAVTFVVIQVADFMVPALRLPETVSTIIAVIALVGFPISMVLAWIVDVTSSGLRVTEPSTAEELEAMVALPAIRRWPVGLAALAGLGLLIGGVWLGLGSRPPGGTSDVSVQVPAVGSVAVMPFLTLDGGGDGEYLGEGVANELLGALSRVEGLRVTGPTSGFSLMGAEAGLDSVFSHLGVAALLEGSVVHAAGAVELALRLVAAGQEGPIWTGAHRLPEEDFLGALDEVAWSVAGALGASVAEVGRGRLVPAYTRSFSAYSDYLKGRHLSNEGTPAALESAIAHYHRALLLDPEFSAAWAALSTALVLLPEHGGPSILELLPYARAALDRALAPGAETAEGYAASGYLKFVYVWDLPGAETDLLRSIQLDSTNASFRHWHAQLLATRRGWDEALAEANRALELDPLSPVAHLTLGLVLMCAGRDGAAAAFRRALELAPDMHPVAYVLGGLLAMEGDVEGAGEAFDRFAALTGSDRSVHRAYLAAVTDPSKRPQALAALQQPGFFGLLQGAELLAHLGENDAALALLERAVQERSPYLPWINALPQYDGIRSDPRFQSILAWVTF
jgi:TolB-like protein/tetratricopeptide (TPR) repeat protein